jgi:hypothetical protein
MTPASAMERLEREDAIGQLRRRDGTMARLGSESGELKLDWVDMVPWLLAHPDALATVEHEAMALSRGARHVIWAGMGGSVQSVRVMRALGYTNGPCALHPLDSTDPSALNAMLHEIGDVERAVMVGVAMGMTSEEPISHLEWFAGVLSEAGLDPVDHQLVLAMPDSYLDRYAREHGLRRLPLQLDGGSGTGGRMSAPGTLVFLLPAALYLAGQGGMPGALYAVLRRSWEAYDLDGAEATPRASAWARLAVSLASVARNGSAWLGLETPPGWEALRDWCEQLMEESLGKGGKGVIVFAPNALPQDLPALWRLRIASGSQPTASGSQVIVEPLIASGDPCERLAGLATLYLGFQLAMALYGYLWDITFAGQPAVEQYKTRARALRDARGSAPLGSILDNARKYKDRLLVIPPDIPSGASSSAESLIYLDVTINGEAEMDGIAHLEACVRRLAVERLGIPYKLRRAPAAYHSTEQSEMDGPAGVLSYRALALRHPEVERGEYEPRFLEAQAVATFLAMNAQGRKCYLALYDGTTAEMLVALDEYFDQVEIELGKSGAGQSGE